MITAEIENELDGWTIKINNRLKKNYKRNFRTKVIQLPQHFVDEVVDDPGHWLPWLWEATHNKDFQTLRAEDISEIFPARFLPTRKSY